MSAPRGLFLFVGSEHHGHPLSLEDGHVLSPSVFLKLDSESEELLFALVLEHDRTSAEEDRRLYLGAFLEELLGMLELELEVMLIGVGPEADLLDDHLGGVGFHLLGLLLLLIGEFLVIEDLANGGIRLGADLHQIQLQLIRHLESPGDRVYTRFRDILPYQANLLSSDLLIYVEFVLVFLLKTRIRFAASGFEGRLGSVRSSDS